MYPNLTQNHVCLEIAEQVDQANISITSLVGKVVEEYTHSSQFGSKATLGVSGYTGGMYIVSLESENEAQSKIFIKRNNGFWFGFISVFLNLLIASITCYSIIWIYQWSISSDAGDNSYVYISIGLIVIKVILYIILLAILFGCEPNVTVGPLPVHQLQKSFTITRDHNLSR